MDTELQFIPAGLSSQAFYQGSASFSCEAQVVNTLGSIGHGLFRNVSVMTL